MVGQSGNAGDVLNQPGGQYDSEEAVAGTAGMAGCFAGCRLYVRDGGISGIEQALQCGSTEKCLCCV